MILPKSAKAQAYLTLSFLITDFSSSNINKLFHQHHNFDLEKITNWLIEQGEHQMMVAQQKF